MTTTTDVTTIEPVGHREAMRLQATEFDRALAMLRTLDAKQWITQTNCPDWDVRRMWLHVLGASEAGASMRENMHQMRVAHKSRRKLGVVLEAGLSGVQVADREGLSADELLRRLAAIAPKTVKGRSRTPRPMRAVKIAIDAPVVEKWTLGYLIDVIYLRDAWMHRVDTASATGAELVLTADHDGRIVADVVAEWARRHGQPFTLELTGPAGGGFTAGGGGESTVLDAVEFCFSSPGAASQPASSPRSCPSDLPNRSCSTKRHQPKRGTHGRPHGRDHRRDLSHLHVRAPRRGMTCNQILAGVAALVPHRHAGAVPSRIRGGQHGHPPGVNALGQLRTRRGRRVRLDQPDGRSRSSTPADVSAMRRVACIVQRSASGVPSANDEQGRRMSRFTGRTVVVTGGGGGIGTAVCRGFATEGASVAVLDRDVGAANATASVIETEGGRAIAFECDITERPAADATIERVRTELGPIDVLVNNAGWDLFVPFLATAPEDWSKLIDINLVGPLNMHHVVLPGMVERGGGRIVNVSSDAARVGSSGEAVYAACKAGLIAFSKTLAREHSRHGITFNVVCPGPTDTALLTTVIDAAAHPDKLREAYRRSIPMGRLGQPDDLVGAILFFASDAAAFVTGQVLSVSGGLTMAG